jgi:hypothetical protein
LADVNATETRQVDKEKYFETRAML